MDSFSNWSANLKLIGQTANDICQRKKQTLWDVFLDLLQPMPFQDLTTETKQLLLDGLDEANFEEPKHYCWVLVNFYGSEYNGGMCEVPYDCGACTVFQSTFPSVMWLCTSCLNEEITDTQGRSLRYESLEGFYHSGQCFLCRKESIVLSCKRRRKEAK